jgi:hypothetical protein
MATSEKKLGWKTQTLISSKAEIRLVDKKKAKKGKNLRKKRKRRISRHHRKEEEEELLPSAEII